MLPTAGSPWRPIYSRTPNCAIAAPDRRSRRPNCCCRRFWTMPRVEPGLLRVLIDLERGLRELGIPFGIVGALVPELLLDARPSRLTNDADAVVVVQSRADFEGLKDRLVDYGFTRTRSPHRLKHRAGGLMDILPFSEAIAPGGRLELEEGLVLNMAGVGQ